MREMANISRDLLSYQSMTEVLVNRSADIRSTVCNATFLREKKKELKAYPNNAQSNSILKFRSQEMLTDSGEHLRRIAEVNSRETASMTSIAKWSYRDSRTVCTATTIGLVYLPANLVLVCHLPSPLTQDPPVVASRALCSADARQSFFSTSFVEFASQEGPSGDSTDTRFLVRGQVWVALVAMFVLILITGCWYLLLNRWRCGCQWHRRP